MLYDKACGATATCEDGDPAAVHWSYGERGPAGESGRFRLSEQGSLRRWRPVFPSANASQARSANNRHAARRCAERASEAGQRSSRYSQMTRLSTRGGTPPPSSSRIGTLALESVGWGEKATAFE